MTLLRRPVVNFLLNGKYGNRSRPLCRSRNLVFSAYPPLYQVIDVIGNVCLAAMAFHLVLFGVCWCRSGFFGGWLFRYGPSIWVRCSLITSTTGRTAWRVRDAVYAWVLLPAPGLRERGGAGWAGHGLRRDPESRDGVADRRRIFLVICSAQCWELVAETNVSGWPMGTSVLILTDHSDGMLPQLWAGFRARAPDAVPNRLSHPEFRTA
jgi:hypothetical protein